MDARRSHAGEERTPVDGIGRRSQRRLRSGPGILWKSSGREVDGSNTPHSSAGEGSDAREEDASKDNSDGVNEIQTVEKVPSDGEGDESQRSADMSGGNVGNEDGVAVDPPEQWHDSWKAWQTYLAEYCARTMQILPVKETMSRSERNRRLQKTKKGSAAMLPDGCDPYQRTYTCTHGWLKRKSRSDGGRPRQHIRLTNCPFRFIVQWDVSRLQLRVKNGCFLHNHPVSKAAYKTNPSSRGVKNPLIEARVEGMQAVGARRSRIYDYLLAHDQNVIQSDVDNMVREHASSVATVDDNETTAQEVALFPAADPENVSSIAETVAGETGVISLVTAHMRRMYGRFSELLLVDCSHKTNRYNYQLLTFMAMNEFGEGAVVQQSLLEANGDWHMDRAIAHFKRSHPTRIEKLRVIVVDKDLNEIRVLEANFPGARILICHFHAI
ncbi:hypothetical protein PR003_g24350 [Phytophthora rubi]|uniref:ZSWIM1/3 RNaseH-like domain-containing protein n=1 Tax=Phytophthora rubi TaxID=129364 RepID=A0A6A4CRS1_9STRA|nr:hypothetical protein PR003_g24350 [Phytophthora rubi]